MHQGGHRCFWNISCYFIIELCVKLNSFCQTGREWYQTQIYYFIISAGQMPLNRKQTTVGQRVVCLFVRGFFVPLENFSLTKEKSPLHMKGCKSWTILGTHLLWHGNQWPQNNILRIVAPDFLAYFLYEPLFLLDHIFFSFDSKF